MIIMMMIMQIIIGGRGAVRAGRGARRRGHRGRDTRARAGAAGPGLR